MISGNYTRQTLLILLVVMYRSIHNKLLYVQSGQAVARLLAANVI